MDLVYYSGYKRGWLLAILLVVTGCGSSGNTVEPPEPVLKPGAEVPDLIREQPSSQILELTYTNESTSITVPIDLYNEHIYLELRGSAKPAEKNGRDIGRQTEPQENDRSQPQTDAGDDPEDLFDENTMDVNRVMTEFVKAQNAFYRGDYPGAMEAVNRSLEAGRTADANALKGTIYFMLGNSPEAQRFWTRAMRINPDIAVPDITELEELINEIEQDDINSNDE